MTRESAVQDSSDMRRRAAFTSGARLAALLKEAFAPSQSQS